MNPPVVVGDNAQVRPEARKEHDKNYGWWFGRVVGVEQFGTERDYTAVWVQFSNTKEPVLFALSELSILPNFNARRGEKT